MMALASSAPIQVHPQPRMHVLAKIRHIVLDMDGTIYLGKNLFPQTLPFLDDLARMGIGHSYVTNNCSRSRAEYVHHLREIGIDADPSSISTSAHATIHYLSVELPQVRSDYLCMERRGLRTTFAWRASKSLTRIRKP